MWHWMSDRFRIWGGCFVLVFSFAQTKLKTLLISFVFFQFYSWVLLFSLVLAGLVSCLSPPSFIGVFLVSLLLCIILFWLCVVYVVVNFKNRISPWKRLFLDGFGWVPQDPIPQKGVWCTFTVFIVSCFGCSSNVCFLFVFSCFLSVAYAF